MPAFPPPEPPSVSVVIPAWNAAATLARALDSVAAQNLAVETIVVDDGSTDGTADLAAEYQRLPVRVVRLPVNRGVAAASNAGVAAASGEHVAFLDADDEWLPGKLAAQRAAFAADPALTFVATHFAVPGGPLSPPPAGGPEFWRHLLVDSAVLKSSVMAPRRGLLAAGGFDETLPVAEDQDLFLSLARAGPAAYLPTPYVIYHPTPGSLTTRHPDTDVRFVLPVIERHLAALGSRLTGAERRAVRARRHGIAAQNLADSGHWWRALPFAARAMLAGDRPVEHLSRLTATAPGVSAARRWLASNRA